MSKYTPGPYYVESDGRGPYVCAENQGRVATIECQSFKSNGGLEDWANARLIAAAPELLAALQALVEFADYGNVVTPSAIQWSDAREAIAKATGAKVAK